MRVIKGHLNWVRMLGGGMVAALNRVIWTDKGKIKQLLKPINGV